MNNTKKFKNRKKKQVYFFFKPLGWVLFIVSVVLFPRVYTATYIINRKYKYTHKQFFKKYLAELKDMLLGTWWGYE